MILLLAVVGIVVLLAGLGAAASVRALFRRDHRCRERTLADTCARCAAVRRDEDRGGHLVCACGAVSPHLLGADLLRWRATHHGEELPPLRRATDGPAARRTRSTTRSTTRGRAAAQAEARVQQALAEELSETQRRMIEKARRNPDPITPQLLRQAEELGVEPVERPAPHPAATAEAAAAEQAGTVADPGPSA